MCLIQLSISSEIIPPDFVVCKAPLLSILSPFSHVIYCKSILTKESIDSAKQYLADDFGERQSMGPPYLAEVVQYGKHYCICEVTVSYEHVNVIYRITYDQDMQISGLYIR